MNDILIVDDHEEMRDLYFDFFNHDFRNQELTFSPDGIDAFFKCSMQKYDLITLDHEMPRLNGLDLLVILRNSPGLNQHTPIIVISAFLPKSIESKNLLENVYFISKPFNFDSLSDLMKTLLQSKSPSTV
ncbi:MAG: response regulator [Bacteriovorax sp.]|nr:response regulator [Bacteriovorax sp.]